MKKFDVIVIGGGHAGIEAAYASANMRLKTLLVTIDKEKIGHMPCNPSVGGLGKGHIVYEVSALGGLMPKLCSKTYLQSRMLNTSKGPAVQGLRLQIDKYEYSALAQKTLLATSNLQIYEGIATQLLVEEGTVSGVVCKDEAVFHATSIVITTGTFLNGTVHIGEDNHPGGRMGEDCAIGLSSSLASALGVEVKRLKTGTPPRLLKSSIDYNKLERQRAHLLPYLFEFNEVEPSEKVSCYITQTNGETHQIIKDNLHKSAMYSGNIKGVGPRYCPSIEDKVARFPDKQLHYVFVEPEGLQCEEAYPAGLSTSLPSDIQEQYIHSIKGFENAIITKPGYAIEYDFFQPTHLKHTLESKKLNGLFFAGQINGTTGYEEAAGQGVIAGVNASLRVLGKKGFVLGREESYIGVMIDDLVTLGTNEPYRMFTSRAERRLLLRQDNAFLRIMPHGYKLGLIADDLYNSFLKEKEVIQKTVELCRKNTELKKIFSAVEFTDEDRAGATKILESALGERVSYRVLLAAYAEIKYAGYLDREQKEIDKARRYRKMLLPVELDYEKMPGLTLELQEKLVSLKPETIAQAQLIPGITPAAISLLILQTKLLEKRKNVS